MIVLIISQYEVHIYNFQISNALYLPQFFGIPTSYYVFIITEKVILNNEISLKISNLSNLTQNSLVWLM